MLDGYSSAILSKICKTVDGLEQHEELVDIAKDNIKKLGIESVKVHQGNLKDGHKKKNSMMLCLLTVLLICATINNDQVKDGGRVVTIKRDGQIGYMVILKKLVVI